MSEPKLSVALAVYNGEKYIGEQLESLAVQTRPPDELVVWDNASSDGTLSVVRSFAEKVSFPVRVFEGTENLGYTKGSEKAVERCEGGIIFPCDDDDVWLSWKLAEYEGIFRSRPEIVAAFSNSVVVDDEMKPTGTYLWETANFNAKRRRKFESRPFEVLLQGNVVYGNTFAFRRDLLDVMLPFSELWDADEWIALLAAVSGRMVFLDRPSIKYRQHARNFVGAKRKASLVHGAASSRSVDRRAFYEKMVAQHEALMERITRASSIGTDAQDMRFLREKTEHLRFRARLGGGIFGRARSVASEAARLRYHRHSDGLRSIARDVLIRGV